MITEEDPPASGATRVDQHWSVGAGQPGGSNRARRDRGSDLPDRHLDDENLAMNAAAAAITAATASAHADPAGPGSTGSGASARAPPGEHHPDRLDPSGEAPQPAAHRLRAAGPAARRSAGARPGRLRRPTPPRSPRRCPRGGPATTPAAAHASPGSRCTAPAAARSTTAPSASRTSGPGPGPTRPAPPSIPDTPTDPNASRSSTATGSVSTVSIAPPSATTRPSRTARPRTTAGGPWPTPTRRSSRWRRRRTRSTRLAHQHAIRTLNGAELSPYVVILRGGQQPLTRIRASISRPHNPHWIRSVPLAGTGGQHRRRSHARPGPAAPPRSPLRSPARDGTRPGRPPTRPRPSTAPPGHAALVAAPHLTSRVARVGQDHRHRPQVPPLPAAVPIPLRVGSRRARHTALVQLASDPGHAAPGEALGEHPPHMRAP